MRKEKRKPFFKKYINGTKGAISLFLAILMVPFVTIAGALINVGRYNSAIAIFDEALCNASNSTLGTYDEFLRNRFGLLATSQNTATGALQFGKAGANYTADQFLNDLFQYYMEQNVGTLSNTFKTTDVSVQGLYPLAEQKVLRQAVLTAGKLTVPAKMVADWGSLDKLLSKLTDQFKLFESFTKTIGSGATVVTNVDKLLDSQKALEEQIDLCNTAITNYDTAYTNFKKAAESFNELITNIDNATKAVNTYQKKFDELAKKVKEITEQIAEKNQEIEELKKDSKETKRDNTEKIDALKAEIEELELQREAEAPGYNDALQKLNQAKASLKAYQDQFPGKRSTLVKKKDEYYSKISSLMTAVNNTGKKADAFQTALKTLIDSGVDLLGNAVETGFRVAQDGIDKNTAKIAEDNEYYRYQQTLADQGGYTEESIAYGNMIQENVSAERDLNNKKNGYTNGIAAKNAATKTMKDVNSGLTQFASRDIIGEYDAVYEELKTLSQKIDKLSIPNNYKKFSYANCHVDVKNPMEKKTVGDIIKNVTEQFVDNAGWAALKAALSFFEALMTLDFGYTWGLTSELKDDVYKSLPSVINRDKYALTSPYDAADAAASKAYKEMLNGYGDNKPEDIEDNNTQELVTTIVDNFYILWDGVMDFKLSKLGALWDAVTEMFSAFTKLGGLGDLAAVAGGVASAVINNSWLVGYISYNTANRTTYQGKSLTGAFYALPNEELADGELFVGAETEYIYNGNRSEKKNQEAVFWSMMIVRALFNIGNILADGTVQTIASTLGSFTFGIGTVLTYIVFLFLESFVDVVILANGGDIPIIKTFVYVTPTGIPRLVKKVLKLSLSEKQMKDLYETVKDNAYEINEKAKDFAITHGEYGDYYEKSVDLPRYDDYKKQQSEMDKKNEVLDLFVFNYTKTLQLIMLYISSPLNNIKRLADVIQMEANYKAKKSEAADYEFNLDKSYTYLRASGSFSSNAFIKIGENDIFNSKHRVIYNGY